MLSSLLARFASSFKNSFGINTFRPSWHCLIVKVMQLEQNFLNHLVTLRWSTAPSPFTQQISWTICLLYDDQLPLHLLHNKFLEPSAYSTMINCPFTFYTTNFLNSTSAYSTDQLPLHLLHNKFLEPSAYSTMINCFYTTNFLNHLVINCPFTFYTTNFLNHLLTLRWSTAPSPFTQQISWTICLLYDDQLPLHLLHNKYFCFFGAMVQFKLIKYVPKRTM